MELSNIEIGPSNPAPLNDPLTINLHFKNVDQEKKFKLSLIADVTNKRHIAQVPPLEHQMSASGELKWEISGQLFEGFTGNVGMISVEEIQTGWKCNWVVMVNANERTVLSPLE